MAKRKTYTINGELFLTRKALEEKIRSIRDKYKRYERYQGEDFKFIAEGISIRKLIPVHEILEIYNDIPIEYNFGDKVKGYGIAYVTKLGKDFCTISNMGAECDRKAATRLNQLLRDLSRPFSYKAKEAYKNKTGNDYKECSVTKKEIKIRDCDVHHSKHPFAQIKNMFLNKLLDEGIIESLEDLEINSDRTDFINPNISKEWIKFHNHYASKGVIICTPEEHKEIHRRLKD